MKLNLFINYFIITLCLVLFSCSQNIPEVSNINHRNISTDISSMHAYEYYSQLEYDETPYTYIMNKYLDLTLEYLYGWDDSYLDMDIEEKQSIINRYADGNPDLEETLLGETEFDAFFSTLHENLIDELNSFPIIQSRLNESLEISGGSIEDIDLSDMIISIGGVGYSKIELLKSEEFQNLLVHESFSIEEERNYEGCDYDCEPNYASSSNYNSPRRLNRYFLLSLWLTDIRYRNYNNTCPNIDNMREAMNEWENASAGAIHFREISDNGWNRFTWGIGCNYHVKLSLESDPRAGGSSTIGAVPWAHCQINTDQSLGVYLHELGHILGLLHEQTRPDRDCHINICWDNILPGYEHNFHKYLNTSVQIFGDFDFESIMMYGSYSFTRNGSPTMKKLDGSTFNAQRENLSASDVQYIQYLYN